MVIEPFVYICKASKAQTRRKKREIFLKRKLNCKPMGIEREEEKNGHVKAHQAKARL